MVGRTELKRVARSVGVQPARDRGLRLAQTLARTGGGPGAWSGTTVVLVVQDDDRSRFAFCLTSVGGELGPGDRLVICPVTVPAVVDGPRSFTSPFIRSPSTRSPSIRSPSIRSRSDNSAPSNRLLDFVQRGLDQAAIDRPVEVMAPQPIWPQAANAGATHADTEFVMFLRGSDRLVPGALAALVRDAESKPGLVGAEGRLRATGGRIITMPTRLALGNRVIRLSAWRAANCAVANHDDWLLATPVARLTEQGRFRESDRAVVEFAPAHGARSTAADPSPMIGLASWLTRCGLVRTQLAEQRRASRMGDPRQEAASPGVGTTERGGPIESGSGGSGPVDSGWAEPGTGAWRALAEDTASAWLPLFLMDAERANPAQWDQLVQVAEESRIQCPETRLASTPARVLRWLAAADRRDEVIELAAELETLGSDIPTRLVNRRVIADWCALPSDFPQAVATLSAVETRLKRHLHRMVGDAERRMVELFVTIDRVDLAGATTDLTAADSAGREIPVTRIDAGAVATRWWQRRFQSGAGGTFRLTVSGPDPVTVHLRFTVDKLVRTGRLVVPPPANRPRRAAVALIDGVSVADRDLVVSGAGRLGSVVLHPERPAADLTATPATTAPITRVPVQDTARLAADLDDGEVLFSLETVRFGRLGPLPPGRYRLVSSRGHTQATAELRAKAPIHRVGPTYRLQIDVDRARRWLGVDPVRLWLRPPLTDDELGPYAQQRLQDRYRSHLGPVDPEVYYFETYAGRSATDNPLAVFRELRAQCPQLRAYWGVADHSQWVPHGATRVLRFSRQWYDLLATAGCLVLNTDVEPWFTKRPGQFVVQCFHGYPSKAMGAMQWASNELSPAAIRLLRQRGVDIWDLILSPTPAMTRHYREQYDYRGPVFEHGYPRNDDLTGPEAEARRSRVRHVLGIAPEQTAVLYAPTWRDHLSIRPRAAHMTDFFDVTAATEELGDSHVVLVRGHRFHQPDVRQPGAVDVTDHPEINDLILASDVAVLDYSSLRFDYALTGKPMVFLVPDLDEFTDTSRGFLFPFLDSAPGPLVEDTAAVIDHVRDVARLQQRYRDRLEAFNEIYNPEQDGHAAQRAVAALLSLREP
ncbi:MAG: CDP-glycerol glycerophosphotransferase family protein [Nocardioides sp.]